MRYNKRKILSYALCAVIFAATMWAALRLSFPPDPLARHMRLQSSDAAAIEVSDDNRMLTIRRDGDARRYRFRETDDGVVAEEVVDEQ